jgi:SAM-dependent methyltransferase
MPAAAEGPALSGVVCPACRSTLVGGDAALRCEACGREYPVVAGIPELRLAYPDPYVGREEDLERARELAARSEELDFPGLLREHWARSGKAPELADRFVAGDLASLRRSQAYLSAIERERGAALGGSDRFLEIGCGTAGLAAAAAERAGEVIASDLSMRWLVLARKRLMDAGIDNVRLICGDAERPPFAAGFFDVVAASDVIEHVPDPDAFAEGCRDVLRPGGSLFLATPNRYSLGLEPHVRLWGVGYLPRPLAKRYVWAARKAHYDHVRLLSSHGLRRLLRRHGFGVKVVPPEIPAATQEMYSGRELRLVRAYNRLRRLAPVRAGLRAVGPFFHVFARKPAA